MLLRLFCLHQILFTLVSFGPSITDTYHLSNMPSQLQLLWHTPTRQALGRRMGLPGNGAP